MPRLALPGTTLFPNLNDRAEQTGFSSSSHFWFKRRIKCICDLPRGTRGKAHLHPALEVAHLAAGGRAVKASPLAALLGANLLKRLINNYSKVTFGLSEEPKGGCDLPRGTRGKAHLYPALEVAHLAAGGPFSGHVDHKRLIFVTMSGIVAFYFYVILFTRG